MKGYYAIFECSSTLELCVKARQAGFPAWIPIEMYKRVVNGRVGFYRRPALPGYIFIGWEAWRRFYEWGEHVHPVRVMTLPGKNGDLTPVRVNDLQLYDMDKVLRKKYRDDLLRASQPEAPTEAAEFKSGQMVEIIVGPFEGLTGKVSRYRNGKVRVQFGNRYVVMPPEFMAAI